MFNCHAEGAGQDFVLGTTSITFGPGAGDGDTMDVSVTINDDAIVEGLESYTLSVTFSSGLAVGVDTATALVNLADNDGESVSVSCACSC